MKMSMATTRTTATMAAVQAPLSRVGPTLSDWRPERLAPVRSTPSAVRAGPASGEVAGAGTSGDGAGGRAEVETGGGPGAGTGAGGVLSAMPPAGPRTSALPSSMRPLYRRHRCSTSCLSRERSGSEGEEAMTRSRDFMQVDVFTTTPYKGNPVAVVLDGADLSDEQMQQVASWTNLSETTFVFPPTAPGADYRVRIFTTSSELPFAGHPTLGTAHAFMAFSGVARDSVVQECAAGLVPVRRSGAGLAFAAPPMVRSGAGRRGPGDRGAGRAGRREGRGARGAVGRQRAGMGGA